MAADRPRSFQERLYRLLFLAYSKDVRELHRSESWLTFQTRLQDARAQRGFFTALKLWPTELAAALRHGITARLIRSHMTRNPVPPQRENLVRSLLYDARHALRSFRKNLGFTAVVILTLAIGIGANTAIFSVVNGVLLTPLPYPESNRLMALWGRFLPESGFDFRYFPVSPPEFFDYREQSRTVADVAGVRSETITHTADGADPIRIPAAEVTHNLFALLGTPPQFGRVFNEAEDIPNGPAVAILGHGIWESRFSGDPTIVGTSIQLNGVATQIVGVMPPGFAYPRPNTQVYTPLALDPASTARASHFFGMIGRMAPEVTQQQVDAELETMMAQWKADFPDIHTGHFLFSQPLIDNYVRSVRPALLVLFGAVGFVLLIVCANVANLLLARGEHRQREIAVRAALGAGRGRILRQLLTESALLTTIGGALGLAVGYLAINILLSFEGNGLPRTAEIGIDLLALTFTATVTVLCTVVFGLVPAYRAGASAIHDTLREGSRYSSTGGTRLLLRRGLVVAEVALSLLLVIGAGLTLRSFGKLLAVDPGFTTESTLLAELSLPSSQYASTESALQFYSQLLERLRAHPAVQSATAATSVPIYRGAGNWDFQIEGRPEPQPGEPAISGYVVYTHPDYFETLNIALLRGRYLDERDVADALPITVINRTMQQMFWPNEDAIGKRIIMGDSTLITVVGVVADVRHDGLDAQLRPIRYLPQGQASLSAPWMTRSLALVIRTAQDPAALTPFLRRAVAELDAGLPITRIETLVHAASSSVAQPRFTMTLLIVFAAIALLLGAIGIYGVMSYTVAQRTREIGIRMALGADGKQMARMVIAQGMALTVIGLATGLVAALAGSHVMASVLFGVGPRDLVTFGSVPLVLGTVALLACALPALRATRVDPMKALRSE